MKLRVPRVTLGLSALAAILLVFGLQHHPSAASLTGVVHSPGEADVRAIAMLDRTYIPGAVRVPGPPSMPASTIESDAVQHSRWFTVTGSMDTVVALLRSNPPTGFALSSVGHTNATGPFAATIVGFHGSDLRSGSLDVIAVSLSHYRVSLRLEAVVGWTES